MKTIRIYTTLEEMFPEGFNPTTVQAAVNDHAQSKQTFNEKFNDVINILADEYCDWYIGYVDKLICFPYHPIELTEEDEAEISKKFIRSLMTVYNFTQDKYLTLLDLYAAQKNHLMDQLNSSVTSNGDHRVNDTPQNAGTGHNNFVDDDHTSMWEGTNNTTTTNSDPTTVMARIKEIQDAYMNVLRDWCREFRKLFITPHNEFTVSTEGE